MMKVEVVREAVADEHPVGLVMLKTLNDSMGYVYYIAVARDYRRKKVATRLLEHSLEYFSGLGVREVYASIKEGNVESDGLFRSRGFSRTSYRELSGKYGYLRALNLYRKMLVVPGETLLCLPLPLTVRVSRSEQSCRTDIGYVLSSIVSPKNRRVVPLAGESNESTLTITGRLFTA